MSDVGEGCLVFGSLNVNWVGAQFVATHVCGDERRTARLDRLARVGPVMALINRNC